MNLHPVAAGIRQIMAEQNARFYERSEAIEAAWLGVTCNEHVLLLGPPGTGKTDLSRDTFGRILGVSYFEAILSKTRPAEAILGPFDIPELRDHGHLFRKFQGFLPSSDYGMLDELGKMSPTLGHDLLGVLLERRLHQVNGGRSYIDLPLRMVMGGSNEWLTDEGDDAAALADRILIRATVDDLQDSSNFAALMDTGAPATANPTTLDKTDLWDAVDNIVPAIKIPRDVIEVLVTLRDAMRSAELFPSPRRWAKSRRLMQASAFLNGRTEVTADDVAVLRFALWDHPRDIDKVERMTLQVSNPLAEKALALKEVVAELLTEVNKVDPGLSSTEKAGKGVEVNGRIKQLVRDVDNLRQEALAKGASVIKIDEVKDQIVTLQKKVHKDLLNITTF